MIALKLLRINLKSLISGMYSQNKKGVKIFLSIMLIYGALALLFLFGMVFAMICPAFYAIDLGWLYFSFVALVIFSLGFITSIFTVSSLIFNAKDNERLLAMPIKSTDIVVSRILTLLFYEYLFTFLVAAPAIFIWWFTGFGDLVGTVIFVLELLLLPLLALALACVVGWLVALISSRIPGKKVFTVLFSLAFMAAYFLVFANLQARLAELVAAGEILASAISKSMFPIYHFGLAVADKNLLSLLLFVLCAVVPFVIMCSVLGRSFIRIATAKRGERKRVYKERALKSSSSARALTVIEIRRLMTDPMVFMNVGLGPILAVALGGFVLVKPDIVIDLSGQITTLVPGLSPLVLTTAALVLVGAAMSETSSISVSLEGKTLWLVKSLPLSGGQVLMPKIWAHMVLVGGTGLFASLCCVLRLPGSALDILAALIAPQAAALAFGFFGLIINLALPKFDWQNPIQVAKQSVSGIIYIFASMALTVGFVFLYPLAFAGVMGVTQYLLALSAFLLAVALLQYLYVTRGGARRFAALG
jgi:ABC-2 type transport system permease protein